MKPILFSTEMVRAILKGKKTVTRRRVQPSPIKVWDRAEKIKNRWCFYKSTDPDFHGYAKPKYRIGDILWVRETWAKISDWADVDEAVGMPDGYIYRADWEPLDEHPKWKPSIFMPKEAARIFLKVTEIKLERIQDITESDAQAEGVNEKVTYSITPEGVVPYIDKHGTYSAGFQVLWDSINEKRGYGWDINPWVWVIEFERCEKPKGWC